MFKLLPIVLLALLALFIVALRYLPWWGVALLLVGLYLFTKLALKFFVLRLFTIPFRAKGAVLKGATAEVHSVTWEPAPVKHPRVMPDAKPQAALEFEGPGEPASQESLAEARYAPGPPESTPAEPRNQADEEDEYDEDTEETDDNDALDEEDTGPGDHYRIDVTITPQPKPGGFQFWEPDSLLLMPYDDPVPTLFREEEARFYGALEVEIYRDGQFMTDEEGKHFGPLRVRLLVGVPLDAPRRLKFRYYFESFGELTLPPSLNVGS